MPNPKWSMRTWSTVVFSLVGGYALIVWGGQLNASDERARAVIEAGVWIVTAALTGVFGRSSLEAWRILSGRNPKQSAEVAE